MSQYQTSRTLSSSKLFNFIFIVYFYCFPVCYFYPFHISTSSLNYYKILLYLNSCLISYSTFYLIFCTQYSKVSFWKHQLLCQVISIVAAPQWFFKNKGDDQHTLLKTKMSCAIWLLPVFTNVHHSSVLLTYYIIAMGGHPWI